MQPARLSPRREDEREFYEFEGTGTLEPVLTGVLLPHNLASPTGFETLCTVERERWIAAA
jgi:hypothetical protein